MADADLLQKFVSEFVGQMPDGNFDEVAESLSQNGVEVGEGEVETSNGLGENARGHGCVGEVAAQNVEDVGDGERRIGVVAEEVLYE
jgi:hypothetical protein